MLDFRIDGRGLDELQALARGTRIYEQSLKRAISRALTATRTAASKEVRGLYNVKAKDVRGTIRLRRPTRGSLVGFAASTGEALPFSSFGARSTRRGVTVRIRKDRGRQRIRRGFRGQGKLPSSRFFYRTSASRLPIKQLFGPSIPQMLTQVGVRQQILARAQEVYLTTLESDLRFRIDRQIARAGVGGGRGSFLGP